MYLLSIDPVRDGYTPEKAQALFEKLPERLKTAGAGAQRRPGGAGALFDLRMTPRQLTAEDAGNRHKCSSP